MSESTPTEPRVPRGFVPSRTNLRGQAGTVNVGESDTLFEIAAGQTEVLAAMADRYPDMSYVERIARLGVVIAADNNFPQLNSRIYLPENRGNPKTLQLRATEDLLRGVEATTDMPQGLSLPRIYEREIPIYPGQVTAIKTAMDTPPAPDADASKAVMREAAEYYASIAQYSAMVNTLPQSQQDRAMGYLNVTRAEDIPATDPNIPTPILDRARTTFNERGGFTGALTNPVLRPQITPEQATGVADRLRGSAVAAVGDNTTIPDAITADKVRADTVAAINSEPGLDSRGTAISTAAPDNALIQPAIDAARTAVVAYNASIAPAPAPPPPQQSVRIRFEEGGELSYLELMRAGQTGRMSFGNSTVSQLPDSARATIQGFYASAEAALTAANDGRAPSPEQVREFAAFALSVENQRDAGQGRQRQDQNHVINFPTASEMNDLAKVGAFAVSNVGNEGNGTNITRDERNTNVTYKDESMTLMGAAVRILNTSSPSRS